MRRLAATIVLLLTLAAGCRTSSRNSELLEAELRQRESEVLNLRAELERTRLVAEAVRVQAGVPGPVPAPMVVPSPDVSLGMPRPVIAAPASRTVPRVESPAMAVPLKDIRVARGSGGIDDDGVPGDEGLLVVVEPRDEDGESVRALGDIEVTLDEVTPQGVKLPVGRWQVPLMRARRAWSSGLFSKGYHLKLAWRTPPRTERVRATARLILPDGRVFEAERELRVRCLPVDAQMPVLVPTPAVPAPPSPERADGAILPSSAKLLLPD